MDWSPLCSSGKFSFCAPFLLIKFVFAYGCLLCLGFLCQHNTNFQILEIWIWAFTLGHQVLPSSPSPQALKTNILKRESADAICLWLTEEEFWGFVLFFIFLWDQRDASVVKTLLLEKIWVWFTTSTSSGLPPPETPASGDPAPSGLHRHPHTYIIKKFKSLNKMCYYSCVCICDM